jgi:uncharacterized protein (TIGR03435 family)
MKRCCAVALAFILVALAHPTAQSPGVSVPTEHTDYDVVSIKRNTSGVAGGGMRTLPDGTMVMTNQPIRSIISGASIEPTREIVGLPAWALSERYDVTLKPPAGSTREQRRLMSQRMFAERFKAVVHVEQRERNGFALVLARRDGQLGPHLKPSPLNCGATAQPSAPSGGPPPGPPTAQDALQRCGGLFGPGMIVSGGMPIGNLVPSVEGLAGGPITDKTGLTGFYAFELHYSRPNQSDPSNTAADPTDAPDFFTAIQEQLGLKLQRESITIPVLVIDRLERPTEN